MREMEGTDFEFDKWDRVRLRDTVDPAFYGNFACVGNEGWVADRRRDNRFGLPEVFIKWDKNHWAYNGAPDRWTFQDHFELVPDEEESMLDNEDELFKKFQEFMKGKNPEQSEPETKKHKTPVEASIRGHSEAEYKEAVKEATSLLGSSEGFVLLAVLRRDHPEAEQGILVPVAASFTKTPEAGLLAHSAANKYAAEAHQDLVIEAITALAERKDERR